MIGNKAGNLALNILLQGAHKPLVNGRANRDSIEDMLVIAILSKKIPYLINEEVVEVAISCIDALLEEKSY